MKTIHRIGIVAIATAFLLAFYHLFPSSAFLSSADHPSDASSLFKPHLIQYKPLNTSNGFTIPELLDLCHYGNHLHISRKTVLGGNRDALGHDFLNSCYPIEITTSQGGRSMGHCSDFAQYIYHGDARLSLDFGRDIYTRKIQNCPDSIYLHGEYLTDPLIYPADGNKKPRNVWLPNLEQINKSQMKYFQEMEAILCKTKITCTAVEMYLKSEEYMGGLVKPKVIYMSHSTPDPVQDLEKLLGKSEMNKLKQDFNGFFHSYGHSGRKRTIQLYDCWSAHPKWPTLTLVGNSDEVGFVMRHWTEERRKNFKPPKYYSFPKNIKVHTRVSLAQLRKLQFSNGVHICPSQQEGYGHYINEGRAVGALVVTTDWAPMNEFVENGNGVLINHEPPKAEAYQGMASYFISPASATPNHICKAIERVLELDIKVRQEMGRKSREAYETDTRIMIAKIRDLVEGKII
ncbi:UNVERIFIED_CONTAM: hypothetical protein HDU68_004440 [Siphonaria sp. JEL0065]|nr:hypothetical protein HDU68_004440 [Siphonaria sp. JEL0065]